MLLQCESERSTLSHQLLLGRQLRFIVTPNYRNGIGVSKSICVLTQIIAYLSDDESALLSSYYSTLLNNDISDMTKFWNDEDGILPLFAKIEKAYMQITLQEYDDFKVMRFRRMLIANIDDEEFIMRKLNFTRYQTSALLNFCRNFY